MWFPMTGYKFPFHFWCEVGTKRGGNINIVVWCFTEVILHTLALQVKDTFYIYLECYAYANPLRTVLMVQIILQLFRIIRWSRFYNTHKQRLVSLSVLLSIYHVSVTVRI